MTKRTTTTQPGDNPVKHGDNPRGEVEIIPPDAGEDASAEPTLDPVMDVDVAMQEATKKPYVSRVKLQTVGQIKNEMGRVYRQVRSGVLQSEQGTRRVYMLRQMLHAAELEQTFRLAEERPDDDRPVFTGLKVVSPAQIEAPKKERG